MTYAQISAFLEVVKLRSISRAAENLFISQSTVSHRLNTLEEELGAQLLIRKRGHKEIVLTSEGEKFVPIAYHWESVLKEIEDFTHERFKKSFSVGSHDSLNSFLFGPIILEAITGIAEKFGKNILRWESHNSERCNQLLESGYLNVAYMRNPLRNRNLAMKPIFSEEFLVVAPENTCYSGDSIEVEALDSDHEIFMSFTWGNEFARWHDQTFGSGLNIRLFCNAVFSLPQLMYTPGSWAIVPASVALECERRDRCKVFRIANSNVPQITTFQVTLINGNAQDSVIRLLEEIIRNYVSKMPYMSVISN